MAVGVRRAAGWEAREHPLADGGEGSVRISLSHRAGERVDVETVDALGRPIIASYGLLTDGTALIGAADIVGLATIAPADRDPTHATSTGLAAPLLDAVRRGATSAVVFVGGTASIDGGLGLLRGLGARSTGADLPSLASLDLGPARESLQGLMLVAALDVASPLCGPTGAAQLFGPQKGATGEQIPRLDAALRRLSALLGIDPDTRGAGAGGGVGAALLALGAEHRSGAALIVELTGFRERLAGADLCLTGEGCIDRSTLDGKTVTAVVDACRLADVPCAVLGGAVTDVADALQDRGAAAVLAIGRQPRPLEDALAATAGDLTASARACCSLVGTAKRPPTGR